MVLHPVPILAGLINQRAKEEGSEAICGPGRASLVPAGAFAARRGPVEIPMNASICVLDDLVPVDLRQTLLASTSEKISSLVTPSMIHHVHMHVPCLSSGDDQVDFVLALRVTHQALLSPLPTIRKKANQGLETVFFRGVGGTTPGAISIQAQSQQSSLFEHLHHDRMFSRLSAASDEQKCFPSVSLHVRRPRKLFGVQLFTA